MINFTCPITATSTVPAIGPWNPQASGIYRNLYLTNNSSEAIWLQFDGSSTTTVSSSTPSGYQLAAKTSLPLITSAPGGRDGCNAVYAVSASGNAILTIQATYSTKTLP